MIRYHIILIVWLGLTLSAQGQSFTLTSPQLGGQATKVEEFNGFGCTGENLSPALAWENPPEGTQSFAITMYDPDAPTGSGWWHWLAFDIPSDTRALPQGAGSVEGKQLPKGTIQSMTSYGAFGFGGPCPPEGHGFHTYMVTVYALGTKSLGLTKDATPAIVGYYLNSQALGKASVVLYYKR